MLDAVSSEWPESGSQGDAVAGSARAKLISARLVSPLWHGDNCTGLSGLYAIINAIRLALAGKRQLSSVELHALFVAGLRFLNGRLTPQQCIASGLRVQLWRQLAAAMSDAAAHRTKTRVIVERLYAEQLSCRVSAFAALEEAILRMRVPMMLCRGGHYTVVSGFTGSSLLLFDSGGACWVSKRVCGVPGDCDGARHVIYPTSFLALTS